MNCFVITCNDSVEYVWIGTEAAAEDKLIELRLAHFDRNRQHYSGSYRSMFSRQPATEDHLWDSYKRRHYWACRETKFTIEVEA